MTRRPITTFSLLASNAAGLLDAWAADWTSRREVVTRWYTYTPQSNPTDTLLQRLAGREGSALTGAAAANAVVQCGGSLSAFAVSLARRVLEYSLCQARRSGAGALTGTRSVRRPGLPHGAVMPAGSRSAEWPAHATGRWRLSVRLPLGQLSGWLEP